MGKKKKIISLIVSVAMLVAMFPMIVHADGPFGFADLQALLEASDGELVSLSENCVAGDSESSIVVPTGANWKINLNGKTIRGNSNKGIFVVESGATLTLMNNAFETTSAISQIVRGFAENGGAICIEENGELYLNPGIRFAGCGSQQNGGAIYCKGRVEICNDVTINNNYTSAGKGKDVYLAEGGTFVLGGDAAIGNVYLAKDTMINMTGYCRSSSIGLETEVTPTASNPVTFATGASYGSTSIFTCASGYEVAENGDVYVLKPEGSVVVTPPSLEYCNITLDGKIGLNVYIDLGSYSVADLEGAYMEFNVGSREPQTPSFSSGFTTSIGGKTLYGFRCDLSSMEMGCDVYCFLKRGEEILAQGALSIDSYLTYVATHGTQLNVVEKSFVNFAYYMWAYMKSIHASGENAWQDPDQYPRVSTEYSSAVGPNDPAEVAGKCEESGIRAASKILENSDISKVTFQLEFDTTNAFMVYFYLDENSTYSANSIPVTVNGETKRAYKVADKKYRVRINDIYLQDLETEYVITGNCGGTEDFTVTASPMSYVYTALCNSASSAVKKDAMVSVYWLWYWASKYNAS